MKDTGQVITVELQQDDLLATKLFRPAPRQDLVHRQRLTGRLAAELAAPLTVVVAPAGWGKTTLLVDWLAAPGEHVPSVAWVTLDEGDNDLVRFLRYLISGVQTIYPDLGQSALSRLQSAQPPAPEAILTPLLNDFAALSEDVANVHLFLASSASEVFGRRSG